MDGYTLYLALLAGLLVLVFFGTAIRKLLKKANIEVDDDQLEKIKTALSDAIDRVEEINKDRQAEGDRPMTGEEKKALIVEMAKDLAEAAGVSEVKLDLLLKLLDGTIFRKSRQIKRARMAKKNKKLKPRAAKGKRKRKG